MRHRQREHALALQGGAANDPVVWSSIVVELDPHLAQLLDNWARERVVVFVDEAILCPASRRRLTAEAARRLASQTCSNHPLS